MCSTNRTLNIERIMNKISIKTNLAFGQKDYFNLKGWTKFLFLFSLNMHDQLINVIYVYKTLYNLKSFFAKNIDIMPWFSCCNYF